MNINYFPYICSLLFDKIKKMFKLRVIGLEDGNHLFDIRAEKLDGISNDYVFKNVGFIGELIVLANKINIKGNLGAEIDLICDRSGNEYTEKVIKEIDFLFMKRKNQSWSSFLLSISTSIMVFLLVMCLI